MHLNLFLLADSLPDSSLSVDNIEVSEPVLDLSGDYDEDLRELIVGVSFSSYISSFAFNFILLSKELL